MVQAVIKLDKDQERVVNTIKGVHGFRNKSEAVNYIIKEYEEALMEPELRPEYIKRLDKIIKGEHTTFSNMDELRSAIKKAG